MIIFFSGTQFYYGQLIIKHIFIQKTSWKKSVSCTVVILRSNRHDIPNDVKSISQREDKYTLIVWKMKRCNFSITSYVDQLNNIFFLSTIPLILGNTIGDDKRKLAIIKFYDYSKVTIWNCQKIFSQIVLNSKLQEGTYNADQRANKYTVSGK